MNSNRFFTLQLVTGLLLVVNLLNVAPDGACFFHCLVAGLSLLSSTTRIDPRIPNDSGQLRLYLCSNLSKEAKIKIPGLGLTPLEYFKRDYSKSAIPRQCLHNSNYNAFVAQTGGDPSRAPLFVETFEEYLDWMNNPSTQVDGLIVAFAAAFLGLDLTVYTEALTEVQEDSDIPDVKQLIAMGFKKSVIEEVLTQTQGNVDAAIEILLQMDSTKSAASEAKQGVWYEQRYCCDSNGIKISLINEGYHFILILPDEAQQQSVQSEASQKLSELMSFGFSREKTKHALIEANGDMQAAVEILLSQQMVMLPEISDELLSSPEENDSKVFIQTREQLYQFCDSVLQQFSVGEFPQNFNLDVQIEKGTDRILYASLLDSFPFPELGNIRYRVVSFRFEDNTSVTYSGSIKRLSHSAEKMQFFRQVWEKIAIQSVTRVVLERC
jgi:hypothetical protein